MSQSTDQSCCVGKKPPIMTLHNFTHSTKLLYRSRPFKLQDVCTTICLVLVTYKSIKTIYKSNQCTYLHLDYE